MRKKKLQVFISSTFTDLIEERQAAVQAILSCGHIPAGMELFTAGDESQMKVIERWIEDSDVYLLILGGRYGSIDPKTGKSYTHLEYEYAIELGKPFFAVVINDDALEAKVKEGGTSFMEKENSKKLKEFRGSVLSKMVKFFDDIKDIKLAIHETMAEFERREKLIGWVRGNEKVNTGNLVEQMAQLVKENRNLRRKVKVFISYSKKDIQLRDELDKFLAPLKHDNKIETWYDRQITPGEKWDDKIKEELRSADIVLCLVSSDFLATEYIMNEELPIILEREKIGLTRLIPVILRPCPWEDTIIAKFQALLGKDKPLTLYENQDSAFTEVYYGIKKVIESDSVRNNTNINTDDLAEQMAELTKENTNLRERLAPSSTETYNGLSFEEFIKILKSNHVSVVRFSDDAKEQIEKHMNKFGDENPNLLHVLLVLMGDLSVGMNLYPTDFLNRLEGLGLVEHHEVKIHDNFGSYTGDKYKFTVEGRKFYLRLLTKFHDKL